MDKIIENIEKNPYFTEEIRGELVSIWIESQKSLSSNELRDLKGRIDIILEKMFKTVYSFSIPMEFINSPVGGFLLKIKLDMGNVMVYGISELVVLFNRSKAMIFRDFHNGKLNGIETVNKRLLVREEAALDYLTTVGRKTLTPEDAKDRIQLFNRMLREGYNLTEIKEKLY